MVDAKPKSAVSFWRKPPVRDLLIIVLAVLLLTLPFINKAFDWDDREYIEFAQVFQDNPSQLHLENLDYKGNFYEQFRTTHPPGVSYYLALWISLGFAISEPLFHGVFILFPLLAAISMYALARRFTRHALIGTLLLLFTPGFIVTSHSLMGDMPGMAMWLLATALFVYGCDRGSWRLLIGSAAAMAAGVMIAYQVLSLLPLLLFYAIIRWRLRLQVLIPMLAPPIVFGVYAWLTRHKYGGWPVLSYRVGIGWGLQDFEFKLRALLVFMGGAIIFPLSLIPLYLRKKLDLLIGFLLLPPLLTWAAVYYLGNDELTLPQALLLALFITAGFLIIYQTFKAAVAGAVSIFRRKGDARTDPLFLSAWIVGVAIYVAIFLPFVSARFLLPLFPPVVLLFMREADELWPMKPRLRTFFIIATMLGTLAMGLVVAIADYHLAGIYRSTAAEIGERYGGVAGRRLWVLSEFGSRYYLQQHGFEYLGPSATGEREPRKGDIVVISKINSAGVTGPLAPGSFRQLENIQPGDRLPIRVMGEEAGAGFYAHLVGALPWTFSRAPLDDIAVYELYWD